MSDCLGQQPIEVLRPKELSIPLVVSSPHSGSAYPHSLLRAARLGLAELRGLEDGFVDELFADAPRLGAPLLHARFARAYVDPNREAFELDAEMFDGPLPDYVNATSVKARAGLGTVPSRIGGRSIYRSRLSFGEVQRRIEGAYRPYHDALGSLLDESRVRFGAVLLLDGHSMPNQPPTGNGGGRGEPVDVALGDRYGRTCAPGVVDCAERFLRAEGLRVARNRPYAGGFITAHYGRPECGVHALQIEIRRGLYMDERAHRPSSRMAEVAAILRGLMRTLGDFVEGHLLPPVRRPSAPACPPGA